MKVYIFKPEKGEISTFLSANHKLFKPLSTPINLMRHPPPWFFYPPPSSNIMADDRSSKLLISFVIFLLLFNYPLLNIVDKPTLWFGFPSLYFYLFLVWGVMILIVARITKQGKGKP
jgi:hypothetical protein